MSIGIEPVHFRRTAREGRVGQLEEEKRVKRGSTTPLEKKGRGAC